MRKENGIGMTTVIATVLGIALVLAASFFLIHRGNEDVVKFETPYQCVLLANGALYFGKLEGYGTKTPLLRDAYYIVSQTNPETKQVSNVLVKRGNELHAPDRMYLNPSQILLVEPVGTNSKVAQLIAESKAGK